MGACCSQWQNRIELSRSAPYDERMPPRREDQGRITPVERDRAGAEGLPQVRQERLPERAAPDASRPPAPRETPQRADQFRESGRLERFIRAIGERIEHGWLYQTFRLPGSSRVVHDRRAVADDEAQRAAAADAPQAMQTREGQLQPETRRAYPNFLGERPAGLPRQTAETQAAGERPLSSFEETLVRRFEGAVEQARSAPDGRPHFLQKTAAQWKAFFQHFLHRTEKKQVPMEVVGDALLFRGLLKKGGDPAKGVVIGDLPLANGAIEKFARFDVQLQAALQTMAQLAPGETVPREAVAKSVQGAMLEYLAIAPPAVDTVISTAARDTQGVFTNLKTEAEVSRQLGLRGAEMGTGPFADAEGRVTGHRGRGGGGTVFGDPDEPPEDVPGQFIPWWRWDREERAGQRRWFTAVTIALLVTLVGLGFWVLLRML